MTRLTVVEKPIRKAMLQFVFPFSLTHKCQDELHNLLEEGGFEPFRLDRLEQETKFYGPDVRVSHRDMERYYLPFSGHVLFPANNSQDAFRRLSKSWGKSGTSSADSELSPVLLTRGRRMPFVIHSADVVLCPFDTGFVTLRVEMDTAGRTFTDALEFADRMRTMEDATHTDEATFLENGSDRYAEMESFLFHAIVPDLPAFLDRGPIAEAYFEKLPFIMDERMFVSAFYLFEEDEDITLEDRYRAARLDGRGADGEPCISATHLPYIEDYCRRFEYDRWAPDTYYLTDESCFCCLTKAPENHALQLAGQMQGEYYYGLLLNLFHRIVLLKLSNAYSRVQLERKPDDTEELIRSITAFSSKYYFLEVVSQTRGREIFIQMRRMYGNDELFVDVKQTLTDLFKYQDNRTSKRSSYLLTILTIYTVISGIYGMNQVIEDLKGHVNWSVMRGYSFFQWFALVVTFSGLVVGFALAVGTLARWVGDWIRRSRG